MNALLTFAIIGSATYLLRSAVVLGRGWLVDESWIEDRIVYVAPAVLAALVASALFTSGGWLSLGHPAEIAAVIVAIVVVRRVGNPAVALVVGLPTYWLVSAMTSI